jgi:hypothetical protein
MFYLRCGLINLKGINLEKLVEDEWIILKWMLNKQGGCTGMYWIHLVCDRDQ